MRNDIQKLSEFLNCGMKEINHKGYSWIVGFRFRNETLYSLGTFVFIKAENWRGTTVGDFDDTSVGLQEYHLFRFVSVDNYDEYDTTLEDAQELALEVMEKAYPGVRFTTCDFGWPSLYVAPNVLEKHNLAISEFISKEQRKLVEEYIRA